MTETTIIRVNKKANYSIISNVPLTDVRLSWKAKGIIAYLLTRPKDWKINIQDLQNRSECGKGSIYSAIEELMSFGYIIRAQKRENGKIKSFEYIVHEEPEITLFPKNQEIENLEIENRTHTNNCIVLSTEETKTTNTKTIDLLKTRKIQFLKTILEFNNNNPEKYPKLMYLDFAKYWIEGNTKKIRRDYEKVFDLSRRLQTWFKNTGDQKILDYWEKEKEIAPLNKIFNTLL